MLVEVTLVLDVPIHTEKESLERRLAAVADADGYAVWDVVSRGTVDIVTEPTPAVADGRSVRYDSTDIQAGLIG